MKELFRRDYLRLKKKGISGILISLVFILISLKGLISFYSTMWPYIQDFISINKIDLWTFSYFATLIATAGSFLVLNLAYCIPYYLTHPFFE